jgi:hypothetical protein
MTESTELIVPFDELRRVSISCKSEGCQAEVTVNLESNDSRVKMAMSSLFASYEQMIQSGHVITFRIPKAVP